MVLALFLMDDLINSKVKNTFSKETQTYMGQVFNQVDQNKKTKQTNPNVPNMRKLMMMCK